MSSPRWLKTYFKGDRPILYVAIATVAVSLCVAIWVPGSPATEVVAAYHGLPADAKDINDLGNSWHIFSLKVDGKTRRFLRHYSVGFSSAESVVELAPIVDHVECR